MTAPHRAPIPVPARAGFGLVAFVLLFAALAPVVAHSNPADTNAPFTHPSRAHLLGTDDVGHDLWAHLVYGSRVSVLVGLATATIALMIAMSVSLVAVYKRGWFESIAFRVVDLTLGLPFLILVIVVAVFIGRSIFATILVLSVVLWARPARVLRATTLRLRDTPHVVVAMASGAPPGWVIRRHFLARITPQVVAQFVRLVNLAVLSEASLAFLGLGDPGRVSWGTTLYFANARSAFLTGAWMWWILPPALGLTLLSSGLALIGFGVEERSDPRLRTAQLGGQKLRRRRRRAPDSVSGPTTAGDAVEIADLVVEYQRHGARLRAVDHVTLRMTSRSVTGLIGESGCGKSSLASAVMGLIASPGEVIAGHLCTDGTRYQLNRPDSLAELRGRVLSLIPQSSMNALNPSQRVLDQVTEAANVGGRSGSIRAHRALEAVHITDDEQTRFPHQLSGGQRQRVVIATAMVNAPRLVIADEATSGLDPLTQLEVLHQLAARCESESSALLLISHDLPLISKVADQIAVMYAGRIVEQGPTSEILERAVHPYTVGLLAAYPRLDRRGTPQSIRGDVPDLADLPPGCAFQTRCTHAEARCSEQIPQLVAIASPCVDSADNANRAGANISLGAHTVACIVRTAP